MRGPLFEVFARTLRGLSAAKITRPGNFRNALGDGFAVRCSYKVGGCLDLDLPEGCVVMELLWRFGTAADKLSALHASRSLRGVLALPR
jgi:hypothetical protein